MAESNGRGRIRTGAARTGLAFAASFSFAAAGCSSITRDELRCEEAVAHILECCPAVASSPVECVGTGGLPFVSFPNVDCLVDPPCPDLQARGVCDWAQAPSGRICP